MTNLYKETIETLEACGKTWDDVEWIGCEDFSVPKKDWKSLFNIECDSGFGGQEIASDLLIVGDGWWLERYECGGSERWVYKASFKKPEKERVISTICNGDSWATLEEMNRPGGKYGED